nr:hypothetical protein CFP56_53573 [Quercus suber]
MYHRAQQCTNLVCITTSYLLDKQRQLRHLANTTVSQVQLYTVLHFILPPLYQKFVGSVSRHKAQSAVLVSKLNVHAFVFLTVTAHLGSSENMHVAQDGDSVPCHIDLTRSLTLSPSM